MLLKLRKKKIRERVYGYNFYHNFDLVNYEWWKKCDELNMK